MKINKEAIMQYQITLPKHDEDLGRAISQFVGKRCGKILDTKKAIVGCSYLVLLSIQNPKKDLSADIVKRFKLKPEAVCTWVKIDK